MLERVKPLYVTIKKEGKNQETCYQKIKFAKLPDDAEEHLEHLYN